MNPSIETKEVSQLSSSPTKERIRSDHSVLDKVLAMWQDEKQLQEIRKIYAPKANDLEFKTFVQMGIATGLNPFLRELWLIKYDEKLPAQIFIGRDGYRRVISRNEFYDVHLTSAVYEGDEFHVDMVNVIVHHVPNLKNRGKLLGAYCLVYMKNKQKPYYKFVEFDEYDLKQSLWKTKPRTMIEKVCEVQAIRMADMTTAGTYSEEEASDRMLNDYPDNKADKLTKRIHKGRTIDSTIENIETKVDQETGEVTVTAEIHTTQPPPSNAPAYTFEELRDQLSQATHLDALTQAASLISSMGFSEDKRNELKHIYNSKLREIKTRIIDNH